MEIDRTEARVSNAAPERSATLIRAGSGPRLGIEDLLDDWAQLARIVGRTSSEVTVAVEGAEFHNSALKVALSLRDAQGNRVTRKLSYRLFRRGTQMCRIIAEDPMPGDPAWPSAIALADRGRYGRRPVLPLQPGVIG